MVCYNNMGPCYWQKPDDTWLPYKFDVIVASDYDAKVIIADYGEMYFNSNGYGEV